MNIFIITSDYFVSGIFGTYTTIKRARMAIEHYFNEESNIVSFEDIGNYTYTFTTEIGETYGVKISSDLLDYEFVSGDIKEDE